MAIIGNVRLSSFMLELRAEREPAGRPIIGLGVKPIGFAPGFEFGFPALCVWSTQTREPQRCRLPDGLWNLHHLAVAAHSRSIASPITTIAFAI